MKSTACCTSMPGTWEVGTPLGAMLATTTDRRAISGLVFADRAGGRGEAPQPGGRAECVELLEHELAEYFAGSLRCFTVALDLRGTEFQRRVWERLCRIPYGQTLSYSDLSAELGIRNGQRAVGLANGRNPVAIVVPCHRVIERGGGLGGYGGGLERKRALLELESGSLFGSLRRGAMGASR